MKKFTSLALTLLLLLCFFVPPASADGGTIRISSVSALLRLAQDCTLDTYSAGKRFLLTADIDLSGTEFAGFPCFSGEFDGGGHTVSGLSITADGSRQGFFRTLFPDAAVHDLNVRGKVTPGGTGNSVGGIAGENTGKIENCRFEGDVSGVQSVGGIAGKNPGVISGCAFSGGCTGEHRVGGIAGENTGTVLGCDNAGSINTVYVGSSAPAFSFDIAAFSEDDFLNITDIGGIAGHSTGTISGCDNSGRVGYTRTGYNVGGIVGRSSGAVSGCSNSGAVLGRKDVGGIVGQLEPYTAWEISDNKLAALRTELTKTQAQLKKTLADLDSGAGTLSDRLSAVEEELRAASDALDKLGEQTAGNGDSLRSAADESLEKLGEAIDAGDYERTQALLDELEKILEEGGGSEQLDDLLPLLRDAAEELGEDPDPEKAREILDVMRGAELSRPDLTELLDAVSGAMGAARGIGGEMNGVSKTVADDLSALNSLLSSVSETLVSTAENVADPQFDYEYDISAEESDGIRPGLTAGCESLSSVAGETNVGGIVGAISYEVAFDREDELKLSDALLSDAKRLIYAAVRDCESGGSISAKKQCAGGVVGAMDFGAVLGCRGNGEISTEGDYCGGVAGKADGCIRNSCSRALLSGKKYVGGIAGCAGELTGCRAYSFVTAADEYSGSVAGWAEGPLSDNFFVETPLGGIDGVSFAGKAEPVSYEQMLFLDGIPDGFRHITVTFVAEGKTVAEVETPFGGAVEKLPQVPDRGLQYWKWDDFDASCVTYSMTVTGRYCDPKSTIASGETPPEFLVEGHFYEGQALSITPLSPEDALVTGEERASLAGAFMLEVPGADDGFTVRWRCADDGTLYTRAPDGALSPCAFERDGSCLVFPLENGGSFAFFRASDRGWILPLALGGSAAALAALVLLCFLLRRKKRRAAQSGPDENPEKTERDDSEV